MKDKNLESIIKTLKIKKRRYMDMLGPETLYHNFCRLVPEREAISSFQKLKKIKEKKKYIIKNIHCWHCGHEYDKEVFDQQEFARCSKCEYPRRIS